MHILSKDEFNKLMNKVVSTEIEQNNKSSKDNTEKNMKKRISYISSKIKEESNKGNYKVLIPIKELQLSQTSEQFFEIMDLNKYITNSGYSFKLIKEPSSMFEISWQLKYAE